MDLYTIQAAWHNYRLNSVPVDQVINVFDGPEYPANYRALLMHGAWNRAKRHGAAGVFWLTCDVALDPDDLEAMAESVSRLPEDVHTGMVKLWPISTGRETWMWSHRTGSVGNPVATQDETAPVAYFSMDCVWMPGRLLDLPGNAWSGWYWNTIDVQLSEIALGAGIAAHAVPGCRPKHLHFTKEHDGSDIQARDREARRTRAGNRR